MNEQAFNLSVRKFLKHFGVTAQREIDKSVDAALSAGKLKGTETLKPRARPETQGFPTNLLIEQDITSPYAPPCDHRYSPRRCSPVRARPRPPSWRPHPHR